MKLNQVLREIREPSLVYKEKRVKDALDRVTVELSGNQSGVMSRLTNRYDRLDKQAKLMTERRLKVNTEMKDVVEKLFNAEDEILTRVVETVSFTITLSKAEKAANKDPKKAVDYAAIVQALSEMVPELTEKIKELTDKYTEIIPAKDTPAALRVKSKLEENILVAAWNKVKAFANSVKSWSSLYGNKLDKLKAML